MSGLVRMGGAVGVAFCLLGMVARHAVAQERQAPVELEWVRLEGAEVCPPKSAFRSALEKRLGSVPFAQRAKRVLTVSLSNENGPFRAVLSLKEKSADVVESKQELFSYSSLCDEVFAATVLSVALLLNPDEANRREQPLEEEDDSGFFDPLEQKSGATQTAATGKDGPAPDATQAAGSDDEETYVVPVAPPPWARRYGYLGAFVVVGLEQLPETGTGLALRAEVPLGRRWLFTMEADWLGAQPTNRTDDTSPVVSQSSGWLGGAWVPHETEHFELWIEGALGGRLVQPSAHELVVSESQVHAAMRLGLGPVFHLTRNVAVSGVASAIFPFAEKRVGEWTQPALGGQIQVGLLIGFAGPTR